ncbi:MAG: chemotaxis protein CheB [Elusimicrobiota bacterium]
MRKSKKPKAFAIVAIGASAGGLRAFEDLLDALPATPGAAFVLVPHLAPQYKSHLAEILARTIKLPVSEVKNGDKVSPNRIYILPPNRAMLIKGGILHLSASGHKSDWLNPIDSFFRSLADDWKTMAIGVLLSGEGSDGTAGLRAIKENGGTTFAQDGKTAAHLSMPQSAAVSGCVDFVLSPAEIGRRLGSARYGGNRASSVERASNKPTGEESLNKILNVLRNAKGVEFDLYKRSTLRRRIWRRMTLSRVHDLEKYFCALQEDASELERLYHDVLISTTSFFREPDSFKVLKRAIYLRILKNRSSQSPIRIWVPGCSTGEEAYSHAMNMVEFLDKRALQIPFHIFATDVNPAVIEKARVGVYPKKIKADVSPERLRRFFIETEDGYRVVPSIRERCIFAVKNLVHDPPFINLDLISCRNLLIYMGATLQEKTMQIFQYSLKPRGILMLGRSETVGDFLGRFSLLNAKKNVFYERTLAASQLDFLQSCRVLETASAFQYSTLEGQKQSKMVPSAFDQWELAGVLPSRYIPNGIIVNGDLEILRFLGNTSSYLRPAPGKPSMNLRRMASGELLLELRAAIHVSKKSAHAVCKEISVAASNGVSKQVRIEVLPIKDTNPNQECFLVIFEDIAGAGRGKRPTNGARDEDDRVIELKEDLAVSGEHLKAIIDEQESTNARLKASNEELLSSNEELQSINEEFETAKEELQSTNEELVTSSEEVRRGNHILNRANSDLANLLASIDIPVVLLGPDLTVRHVTPMAEKALNLSSRKIGWPISGLDSSLRLPNLKQMLLGVMKTGDIRKLEIQHANGRWHDVIIRPYRTDETNTEKSRIQGVVMTFTDIHERKIHEKNLQRLAVLVRDSNDAVIVRDLKNRIIAWNRGARKMYGYAESEVLGVNIKRIIPEYNGMRTQNFIRTSTPIEIRRRTKKGRILDVLFMATTLRDENGLLTEIATTERDITEQKRTYRDIRRLRARAITAQEMERRRFARELHDGVGQILSGVKFKLESLPKTIGPGGAVSADILAAGKSLDRAISEIRCVAENLMPSELEDLGLALALRKLCREFRERMQIAVVLRTSRAPVCVASNLALAIFRVAQEALNNIEKHSKATAASVSLFREEKEIVLSVNDNGIGFNGNRARAKRGIGLESMRERTELIGGSIDLYSSPGAGTRLSVRAPLYPPTGGWVNAKE